MTLVTTAYRVDLPEGCSGDVEMHPRLPSCVLQRHAVRWSYDNKRATTNSQPAPGKVHA